MVTAVPFSIPVVGPGVSLPSILLREICHLGTSFLLGIVCCTFEFTDYCSLFFPFHLLFFYLLSMSGWIIDFQPVLLLNICV